MTKKIINKKGLFNHYVPNQDNLSKEEKVKTSENTSIQKLNNSKNLEQNKSAWKKVNIRMNEENYNTLKIHAILNKTKLEDLFDQIISDFISKKYSL
ncbi:MAG: hypothetical protein P9M11_00460 [Candidatus Tenebribacter burtonii]|jgi:RIO-like serine/threonine protein kinase|nr:hypothetical protein [Candidatus Tenebribacter burtonii]